MTYEYCEECREQVTIEPTLCGTCQNKQFGEDQVTIDMLKEALSIALQHVPLECNDSTKIDELITKATGKEVSG